MVICVVNVWHLLRKMIVNSSLGIRLILLNYISLQDFKSGERPSSTLLTHSLSGILPYFFCPYMYGSNEGTLFSFWMDNIDTSLSLENHDNIWDLDMQFQLYINSKWPGRKL